MQRSMALRYGWVTLAFATFFTAFFAPALFGGNYLTVGGDGSNIALPAYLVPHGLWEPDIMLGYPWASNLSGYWDPLFLLHWIPGSFNAYMLCAYVIAAVGAFGCVDTLTRSTIGGIVAGVAYALGGFMIGHLGHYDVVHPAAWTPYVFWALLACRLNPGLRPIAFGAVAVGLCALAGQPQVLAYTLLFALAYILAMIVRAGDSRRFAAGAFAMLALGIGLAAVALVPGALLAMQSFRAAASLDYFLAYSIPPWQLPIRLLFPSLAAGAGPDAEFSAYVGITTLILAIVAILAWRADRNVRFFALAAVVALVLATGDGFHIAAITFHVPLLNLFRAQGRHMLEFTLFASLLGGLGAAELARGNVDVRRLLTALAVVAVAMAATAFSALRSGALPPAAVVPLRNPAFLVPVGLFIVAAGVLAVYRRVPASRLAAGALAVCTVADLSAFAWFQYWRTPFNEAMLQPPPVAVALRATLERTHQRIFSVAGGTTLEGIPPNLSLVWGVPAAGGYVQLLLTSPGIFLQLFPQGTIASDLLFNGSDRSLDLAAIRYVVIPPAQASAFLTARRGWRVFETSAIGTVLENPQAEPRARIVHHVIAMSPDAALQAIRHGAVDTHAVSLIQGHDTLETPGDPADAAVISELGSGDMHVNVTCRSACFLETSDTYNSMWTATVDAQRVPIHLTDYALRGVFVPAGVHAVAFVYRPWIVYAGGAITLASLGIIILTILRSLRQRSSPT